MPKTDPLKTLLEENNPADDIVNQDDASVEVLSAADLLSEKRLPFILEDGKSVIYFIDPKSITAKQSAEMSRLQKIFESALKRITQNPEDSDAIGRFERIVTAFVKFVLPEIPEALIEKLDYGRKSAIMKYWFNNSGVDDRKNGGGRGSTLPV